MSLLERLGITKADKSDPEARALASIIAERTAADEAEEKRKAVADAETARVSALQAEAAELRRTARTPAVIAAAATRIAAITATIPALVAELEQLRQMEQAAYDAQMRANAISRSIGQPESPANRCWGQLRAALGQALWAAGLSLDHYEDLRPLFVGREPPRAA